MEKISEVMDGCRFLSLDHDWTVFPNKQLRVMGLGKYVDSKVCNLRYYGIYPTTPVRDCAIHVTEK